MAGLQEWYKEDDMGYAFPNLSRGVSFEDFSDEVNPDPTYRSEMEDGTIITRARFTALKESFKFNYRFLTASDKALLKAMQTFCHVGATEIDWTNPSDSTAHTVKLTKPIRFRIEPENLNQHSAMIEFIDA
jgi:hypothetical protein